MGMVFKVVVAAMDSAIVESLVRKAFGFSPDVRIDIDGDSPWRLAMDNQALRMEVETLRRAATEEQTCVHHPPANKIEAIKRLRELTSCGLHDAKLFIEWVQGSVPLPRDLPSFALAREEIKKSEEKIHAHYLKLLTHSRGPVPGSVWKNTSTGVKGTVEYDEHGKQWRFTHPNGFTESWVDGGMPTDAWVPFAKAPIRYQCTWTGTQWCITDDRCHRTYITFGIKEVWGSPDAKAYAPEDRYAYGIARWHKTEHDTVTKEGAKAAALAFGWGEYLDFVD